MEKMKKVLIVLLTVILLTNCATTYELPQVTQGIEKTWKNSAVIDSLPITKGLLSLFDDEDLDSLVAEAIKNNHDLKAAKNRLMASNYILSQTRSLLMPSASLGVSKSRGNQNVNLLTGKNGVKDNHAISLNVAWEVDIWGKLYETNSANTLEWEAQREQYLQAMDALAARTIQTWVYVITSKNELKLKQSKHERLANLFKSIEQQYIKGIATLGDLNNSRSEIEINNAELVATEEEYGKRVRELEILLGHKPRTELSSSNNLPNLEKPIVKIPSVVLGNRPDVKQSILRLNSSLKIASASKKAMLPSLNLSAGMFKEGVKFSDLSGSKLIWNVIGNLVQPIFNGGRLWNEAKAKSLEADAALSDLHSVVLTALKEVEDGLDAERSLSAQKIYLEKSLKHLKNSKEDYTKRFKNGLVPYYVLVNAQNQLSDMEIQINQLKAAQLSNRISLALASGYRLDEEIKNGENI